MNLDSITIYTDGGARGNPGPGACAFVAFANDAIIGKSAKYLGVCTNNDAEYQGVLLALSWVSTLDTQPTNINFYLDSLLIVQQLKGVFKIKQPHLLVHANKIRDQIAGMGINVTYTHVLREKNSIADSLLNAKLDEHSTSYK
jgi:ribonuclease HI